MSEPKVAFTIPELLATLRTDVVGHITDVRMDVSRVEGKIDAEALRTASLEKWQATHNLDSTAHPDIRRMVDNIEEGVRNVERFMGGAEAVQRYKGWLIGVTLTAIGLGLALIGLIVKLFRWA